MRKPRRIVFTCLAVVLVLVLGSLVIRSGGRRYLGRTEDEWIQSLAQGPRSPPGVTWQALGPDAVPILSRALGQGTSPARRAYRNLWFKFPRFLKKRLAMPQDPTVIHRNASLVLEDLTCDTSAVAPALGRSLHDDDPDVRVNAARCLNWLLPKWSAARTRVVPDLLQAAQDTNNVVRENVLQCLGCCPEQSRVIAPALVKAFADPVAFNRYIAVLSFKRLDLSEAARGGAAPLLLQSLTNNDLFVRVNAVAALSTMKVDPAREVPALTEMLGDYRPGVQTMAATALGRYGANASSAVPALQHAFATGEPRLRNAASNSLLQINPAWAPPSTNSSAH